MTLKNLEVLYKETSISYDTKSLVLEGYYQKT